MIGAAPSKAGAEIERKFLLRDSGAVARRAASALTQGYFAAIDGWSVRIRLKAQGTGSGETGAEAAWLTLKSQKPGAERQEIECAVPVDFARHLLADLPAAQLVSKLRYRLPYRDAGGGAPGLTWEVDHFLGRHKGLWLAEIELPRADYPLDLPDWIGPEVTDDPRYRNAALAQAGDGDIQPAPPELMAAVHRLLQSSGREDAFPSAVKPGPHDAAA